MLMRLLTLVVLLAPSVMADPIRGQPIYPTLQPNDRPVAALIKKMQKENEGHPYLNPFKAKSFTCQRIRDVFSTYSQLSMKVEGFAQDIRLLNFAFSEEGDGYDECRNKMHQLKGLVEQALVKGQYLLVSNPKESDRYEDVVLSIPDRVRVPTLNEGLRLK